LLAAPVAVAEDAAKTATLNWKNTASANAFNLLEGVALNAAAGTRTITLATQARWAKLRVYTFFTHNAATTVTSAFSCSLDGSSYARLTARNIDGATATVNLLTDSIAVAANTDYMLEYDTRGCESVRVVFGGASAGASDTVNIQAVSISGV